MSEREHIGVEELTRQAEELTVEQAEQAQGGVAMLLPAVQKVREAAANTTGDPTSMGLLLPYIEQDNLYK